MTQGAAEVNTADGYLKFTPADMEETHGSLVRAFCMLIEEGKYWGETRAFGFLPHSAMWAVI